jgi:hypothetical protein
MALTGFCIAPRYSEVTNMPEQKADDDVTIVPIPGEENEEERRRIRESNDRDQELERRGQRSRHNEGYDEAADGKPAPQLERVTDEA